MQDRWKKEEYLQLALIVVLKMRSLASLRVVYLHLEKPTNSELVVLSTSRFLKPETIWGLSKAFLVTLMLAVRSSASGTKECWCGFPVNSKTILSYSFLFLKQ